MKVSELIEQLQNALSQYGYLRILANYDDCGEIVEYKNYHTGEMCLNLKTWEVI